MLTNFANWSSVLGIVVGIAGLVFSVLAFIEARRSKRAAQAAQQVATESRRDVRTLVAADKFHLLRSRASELISHVESANFPVAVFLARDLHFEINSAINRWEFLDSDTKDRFREAGRVAMQVAEFVRNKEQIDPKDKAKALKKCDLIVSILSGESGKIQSALETRGQQ